MGDCQHTNLTNIEEVRDGNAIRGWYGDCADCPATGIYRPNEHWDRYVRAQASTARNYSSGLGAEAPSASERWWGVMKQALAGALAGPLAILLTIETGASSEVVPFLYALVLAPVFRGLLVSVFDVTSKGGCLGDIAKSTLFGLLLIRFGSLGPGLGFQQDPSFWFITAAVIGAAVWGLWGLMMALIRKPS